jgi:predicted nucleic acid-binding Zn ribbon protein
VPIHDYECTGCKTRIEVFSPKESPPKQCMGFYIVLDENREPIGGRQCEGRYEQVLSTSTSFVLKGKGWAKDGY